MDCSLKLYNPVYTIQYSTLNHHAKVKWSFCERLAEWQTRVWPNSSCDNESKSSSTALAKPDQDRRKVWKSGRGDMGIFCSVYGFNSGLHIKYLRFWFCLEFIFKLKLICQNLGELFPPCPPVPTTLQTLCRPTIKSKGAWSGIGYSQFLANN